MDKKLQLIRETQDWFKEFLDWIESTNLFRLIRDNPYADRIEGISNREMFSLQRVKGMKIERATDLPFPIIINFLRNYAGKTPRNNTDDEMKLKILAMIYEGMSVQQVLDVVIEANSIIGVGLISLGESLNDYCKSKISKS